MDSWLETTASMRKVVQSVLKDVFFIFISTPVLTSSLALLWISGRTWLDEEDLWPWFVPSLAPLEALHVVVAHITLSTELNHFPKKNLRLQ